MTTPIPPELFSQQPIRSEFTSYRSGGRMFKRGPLLLIALFMIIATYFGYILISDKSTPLAEIPTVYSDTNTKQRPDQPGGLDIPHQDMLVFQQIEKGEGDKQQVERLLPPPEMPMPLPPTAAPLPSEEAISASSIPTTVTAPAPEAAVKDAFPVVQQKESPVVSTTVAPVPAPVPASIEVSTAAPAVAPVGAAKSSTPKQLIVGKLPKELFTMKSGKSTTVQLASIGDSLAAQTLASRLQAKYAAQLGGAKLRTVKADLGAKGIFYRVQTEPLTDAAAKNLCAALLSQKAACMIVRP